MRPLVTGEIALRDLFAALTEHTFQVRMGLADPPLTDYLTNLLVRFTRLETQHRFRDAEGRRLTEVADMLDEAAQREARPRRDLHRHIGDYTLFWTGLYPEALTRLRSPARRDHLIDYERQGRESYFIASTFEDETCEAEAPVLRRLSETYDFCREGLHHVREELDQLPESRAA